MERIKITPAQLTEDNHSKVAQQGLVTWNMLERRGLLITVWGCSDARFILPDPYRVNVIRTIAASGSSQPFEHLLRDPSSQSILLVIHHDGDTVRKGRAIKGCGGLAARSDMNLELKVDEEGIEHFIGTHVNHPDPLVQAGIRASAISHRSGKPVLAATQDHLTGTIIPFAWYFWNGHMAHIRTAVLPHYSFQNVYDAARIYANGIPQLSQKEINEFAPEYVQLFQEHERSLAALHKAYPDLAERQKVQQPDSVVIKTSRRPKEITYPATFSAPGSGFTIIVPRYDELTKGKRVVDIHKDDISNVLDQAEYPVSHANIHYGDSSAPFSTLSRIIIETPVMKESQKIAAELTTRSWMREWLDKDKDHKVIVVQEYKGLLEDANWYDK